MFCPYKKKSVQGNHFPVPIQMHWKTQQSGHYGLKFRNFDSSNCKKYHHLDNSRWIIGSKRQFPFHWWSFKLASKKKLWEVACKHFWWHENVFSSLFYIATSSCDHQTRPETQWQYFSNRGYIRNIFELGALVLMIGEWVLADGQPVNVCTLAQVMRAWLIYKCCDLSERTHVHWLPVCKHPITAAS